MSKGKGQNSDKNRVSDDLPFIGCYVKDEYAEEFQVAPSSAGFKPLKSRRRRKWPLWLGGLIIVTVGVAVGFQRHMTDEFKFLSELKSFGNRAIALTSFPIEQVHIVGHERTKEKEIVARLGNIWDSSLISINTSDAKKKIEKLPWIKRAEVERVFPHGINIYVEEVEPVGRFVTVKGTYVFDAVGKLIEKTKVGSFLDLPIFDGEGAPNAASELRQILNSFDDIEPLVVRFSRVDQRRWTLVMHNGLQVFLPELPVRVALNRLRSLQAQHNILNRELAVIDLRLDDRVTLRPKNSKNIKVLTSEKDFDSRELSKIIPQLKPSSGT